MKLNLLAFRDIKANTFLAPMAVTNNQAAIREIADAIANNKDAGPWAKYPDDFELYEIGTYDTDDATIDAGNSKQLLHLSTLKG